MGIATVWIIKVGKVFGEDMAVLSYFCELGASLPKIRSELHEHQPVIQQVKS
jgi:hypothetical protein